MAVAATNSRASYILDKLQSLSGIVPIGAFLAEHIWSNSYALVSPAKYNDVSRELQQVPWRNCGALGSDPVPQPVRHVHLVEGQVERHEPPVDVQLALCTAALDRPDCLRLHRLASLHAALRGARRHQLRRRAAVPHQSLEFNLLHHRNHRRVFPPWQRTLEFRL